jgi:ABC-type multidrug transport system permease subunit
MTRRLAAALVWRDSRVELSYRTPWLLDGIALVSILAIYFYIVRFTHARTPGTSLNFFTYIVPGLALLRFQVGVGRAVAAMDREQSSGTLELLLISSAKSWAIIGASGLYEVLRSAALALIALALGRWVFEAGLSLGPHAWLSLTLGLIGAAAFFLALMAVTCAILIAFKQGLPVSYLLAVVVPVVSGVYFPAHVLPSALKTVTDLCPLTLAVDVVRAGVVGATFPAGKALLMLATTFACLPLAALAVHAAVNRARRLGTLGQY